ncbi:MAG TPA: hypothetical protein VMX13_12430 [Sedimentisphaerales bacterium]|nr:hypothetical protein [Sedimentisphaerales bacterium]
MSTDKNCCFLEDKGVFVRFLICAAGVWLSVARANSTTDNTEVIGFAAFQQALNASDDVKAASIGASMLQRLQQKYRADAGFTTYTSKLDTAEFLANQMASQLRNIAIKCGKPLADELFTENTGDNKEWLQSIAPAKRLYETSVKLFSAPITIAGLQEQEKDFLAQYYDLKLRTLTGAVAKAGQALAIAEPTFKATYDYVLVLPLLHASDEKPISVNVLPRWMQRPDQLALLSDSCLLHFGFPSHAMTLARRAAQTQDKPFSELEYYRAAVKKCGASKAHVAVDSLRKAIDCVAGGDHSLTADLQFEIVQLWLDSKNYSLAAGEARSIFEGHAAPEQACKAMWLYHYALSRANKVDDILLHVDTALTDSRCEAYKPKLMYVKWWALRRKRDEAARVAALEYQLIHQYGDDPMVAPVMLSQATDLLAHQDYNGAYYSLTQLVEKFPSTKAAEQARKMLEKLKTNRKTG